MTPPFFDRFTFVSQLKSPSPGNCSTLGEMVHLAGTTLFGRFCSWALQARLLSESITSSGGGPQASSSTAPCLLLGSGCQDSCSYPLLFFKIQAEPKASAAVCLGSISKKSPRDGLTLVSSCNPLEVSSTTQFVSLSRHFFACVHILSSLKIKKLNALTK